MSRGRPLAGSLVTDVRKATEESFIRRCRGLITLPLTYLGLYLGAAAGAFSEHSVRCETGRQVRNRSDRVCAAEGVRVSQSAWNAPSRHTAKSAGAITNPSLNPLIHSADTEVKKITHTRAHT